MLKGIPNRRKDFLSKMLTETEKTRKAMLRIARRTRKRETGALGVICALRKRGFPLTFFVRNMLALQAESWWSHASPRLWRSRLRRMLEERSRIFLEVREWRLTRQRKEGGDAQAPPLLLGASPRSGYCNHCGGCCEIASGLPDFPRQTEIPVRWQQLFGNGLGKGHRFCAFLWEIDATGLSVCAIHPWRSNPCRAFEQDECAYFMKDLKARPLFRPQDFSMACQRLSRLIDRR